MISRRTLLGGVAATLSVTAGCLEGDNQSVRCASQAVGGSEHLRKVTPLAGDEQVALGIGVSADMTEQEQPHTLVVRNRDGELVESVPLDSNRDMNRLRHEEQDVFGPDDGELYAVLLGQAPVHGEYTVSLVGPDDEQLESTTLRFNCYGDGSIP